MCERLRFLVFVIFMSSMADGFFLEGSRNSYAGFSPWKICSTSRLSFEFNTYLPNALLLYLDTPTDNTWLEIKLVEGQLRMRIQLSDNSEVMNFKLGENLNNRPSMLYFGGLPASYDLSLESLAVPSAYFEDNFGGLLTNISYTNCTSSQVIEPEVTSSNAFHLTFTSKENCSMVNPCQHNSRCVNTEAGVLCDCSRTEFTGAFCTEAREQTVATFSGSDYLFYNFSGQSESIVSTKETVKFSFKTKTGNGLLFYTGDSSSYMNIGLTDGIVYLVLDMGDGAEIERIGQGRQFDDNYWHEIIVTRESREISASIDGMYETSRSFAGHFTDIKSQAMFVGGAPDTTTLQGSLATQNFHGCMREVRFTADSLHLDVLYMAKLGTGLLKLYGQPAFDKCEQVADMKPISITHPDSYLILPQFSSSTTNFISLTFTTTEETGLLVYSNGQDSDVFALELFEGHLYLILDQSGFLVREKLSSSRVDTGQSQHVSITFKNWGAAVMMNGVPKTVTVGGSGTPALRFSGYVHLAGMDYSSRNAYIHPAVYTASLQIGYVGCLQDVKLDGVAQDLEMLASQQTIQISYECQASGTICKKDSSCLSSARCVEGWNRAICDCSGTGYHGNKCERVSAVARFEGKNHFTVTPRLKLNTLAEQIELGFRSYHSNGALLSTRSKDRQSGLEVFLYKGKLFIKITLRGIEHMLEAAELLNDNQWHHLFISRTQRQVKIYVDKVKTIDRELPAAHRHESILSQTITVDEIRLGQPVDIGLVLMPLSDSFPHNSASFIGHIRSFTYNNRYYMEMAYQGVSQEVSYTMTFTDMPIDPIFPVSYGSAQTYVALDKVTSTSFNSLYLRLRTSDPNGLILYRAGRNGDYIALELLQGTLSYAFKVNGQRGNILANHKRELNDKRWHDISILISSEGSHYLIVDDQKLHYALRGDKSKFHMESSLYIGGITPDILVKLPASIRSAHGFTGCIASLDFNGLIPDIITDGRGNRTKLAKGCVEHEVCNEASCDNGGICIQSWPTVTCQCDMTSYTGPTCSDDGTTYQFGSLSGGLIVYSYPEPKPDTHQDMVALGFLTFLTDCTIVKLTSDNSADFLEISLENGKVVVKYNIGTATIQIIDSQTTVTDGKYHIIRFIRRGYNSTLQVDNNPTQYENPRGLRRRLRDDNGEKLSIFNRQSQLSIGGDEMKDGTFHRPFSGLVSGFSINGLEVLDLAKSNHPAITIHGDARITDLASSRSLMIQALQPDPIHEATDEIIQPVPQPCETGSDPELCLQTTNHGEITTAKIVLTERPPAVGLTTRKPPIIYWPTESPVDHTAERTVQVHSYSSTTIRLEEDNSQDKPEPSSSIEETDRGKKRTPFDQKPADNNNPFDLEKNIPLIAGICGAAILTIVLIAIIICRLTRKEEEKYAANLQRDASIDEDLRNDVNGRHKDNPMPNMPLSMSGQSSRRSDGKEWYV